MSISSSAENPGDAGLLAAMPAFSGPNAGVAAAPPRKLVYVVENDRISSVITELIVRKHLGGQVQCHTNGQSAFNALLAAVEAGTDVPELVLLDLDMPLMDGWDFLDALAGVAPAPLVRVLVLTSSIHPDDLAKASGYAVVKGFFTKPLDEGSVASMQELLKEAGEPVHGAAPLARPLPLNFTPEASLRI